MHGFLPLHPSIKVRGSMYGALKPITDQFLPLEPPKRSRFLVSGVSRKVGVVVPLLSADTPARCAMQQRKSHSAKLGCGMCGVLFPNLADAQADYDDDDEEWERISLLKDAKRKRDYFVTVSDWNDRCKLRSGM